MLDVARSLEKKFKLRAVAVTLRENPRVLLNSWSAIVAAGGKIHRAPRYEVEVVDRIGAGDAFSAGLIVSRLENQWLGGRRPLCNSGVGAQAQHPG